MEESRDTGRGNGNRSRTSVGNDTAQDKRVGIYGIFKGKSILIIYQKFGTAKYKYRCREFWCRGYYVDTTGKNTQVIKEYIRNQLKKDRENMQLSIDYPEDPFTGSGRYAQRLAGRHMSAWRSD